MKGNFHLRDHLETYLFDFFYSDMKTHILLTIALVVYLTLAIVTVAKLDLLDPLENIEHFLGHIPELGLLFAF